MISEDEEYKKVNFEKFTTLKSVFQKDGKAGISFSVVWGFLLKSGHLSQACLEMILKGYKTLEPSVDCSVFQIVCEKTKFQLRIYKTGFT